MIPTSSFQCDISHLFARVPLMNQVNKDQLTAHSIHSRELMIMLNRGCKPVRQCKKIVNMRAATDANDDAVSYSTISIVYECPVFKSFDIRR